MEAIFANIQNALISRILVVFSNGFLRRITILCLQIRFLYVLGSFIFFFKVYSPCMEAIFANIQNAHIFRILVVFKSGFLHTITISCLQIRFLYVLSSFIF